MERFWYVRFDAVQISSPSRLTFSNHNLQTYVPLTSSSSSTAFRRVDSKLRVDWTVAARAIRLICNDNNILDQFWDFDDYLEDNRVPFLTNGTVEPALTLLQQGV